MKDSIFIFTPPLRSFDDIFRAEAIWNVAGFLLVTVFCSFLAAVTFRKTPQVLVVALILNVLGCLAGMAGGVVVSALVAALYAYGGPFRMSWWNGIPWGLALPALYTIASTYKFFIN